MQNHEKGMQTYIIVLSQIFFACQDTEKFLKLKHHYPLPSQIDEKKLSDANTTKKYKELLVQEWYA